MLKAERVTEIGDLDRRLFSESYCCAFDSPSLIHRESRRDRK